MFNKSIAFGLVAAGLMIVPNVAFAGEQDQRSVQETVQEGAAYDGSSVIQTSRTRNNQNQTNHQGGRRTPYGGGYCGGGTSQAQDSVQSTRQAGAAEYGSVVDQDSNSTNRQSQSARRGRC